MKIGLLSDRGAETVNAKNVQFCVIVAIVSGYSCANLQPDLNIPSMVFRELVRISGNSASYENHNSEFCTRIAMRVLSALEKTPRYLKKNWHI